MGLQSSESHNFKNFETPNLGVLGKWHLGATPMADHREYYKGKGGGFPQVQATMNLVDATPSSLIDSTMSLNVKIPKG